MSRLVQEEVQGVELYVKPITQLHPGLCAGGSSKTDGSRYAPPAHAAPSQVASTGFINFSWLFYQVLSEVFSKSSSVMSSLLLL